jgi:tetraacyldisaccharide 4'-kinase
VRWRDLLLPLSPLYGGVVRGRAAAFRRGWLAARRLEVPVVSVGNLTFGGTGKTPTVVALARDLAGRGRRPAVLTRGYGRRSRAPLVMVGPAPQLDVDRAGDEPLELASRLPGVPIVIDADRVRGGAEAVLLGADLLLLDDGFQHLRVERDLDLVLLDAGDPWGGGRLPPRGRLREPARALMRASAVLLTKLPPQADPVVAELTAAVRRIAGALPVLAARLAPSRVRGAQGWGPPELLRGRRLVAFAGIGRPAGFVALLEQAGAEVVASRWFPDHHRYTVADLSGIERLADRHQAVAVTTAKDAVKLPAEAPVWVVEAEMAPLAGSWDELWRLLPGVTR